MTLDQALEQFAAQYTSERRLVYRTRVEYVADLQDAFAYLRDECRVIHVPEVQQSHLNAYLQRLDQRGLSVSTRRRKATSLRVFIRFLSQHDYLLASPADQLLPPDREEPPSTRFLTAKECQRQL